MPFEQLQGAIHGHSVNSRIDLARLAKKLAGVEMLLSSFHNAQDRAALAGQTQPARHKLGLQSAGLFGFRKRHTRNSIATSLTRTHLYPDFRNRERDLSMPISCSPSSFLSRCAPASRLLPLFCVLPLIGRSSCFFCRLP